MGRQGLGGPDGLGATGAEEAVPVLFIGGAGRSGSTLIDRVIGTQPGFLSVGESQFIWQRAIAEDQLCGCGERFGECEFWDGISRTAFGVPVAGFPIESALAWKREVDRKRALPPLLLSRGGPRTGSPVESYGELMTRLYRALLADTGSSVIVDSSKDARHGLLLAHLPAVRLHVLHLVRDPRAVAYSWTRRRTRPEIHWREEEMPIEGVATSSGRWLTQNALVERLAGLADAYHRIRYEDFVLAPEATLAPVLEDFGARGPELLALRGDALSLPSAHTVSGNPMRFSRGPLELREDSEWKAALPRRRAWSVSALTLPLLARYGYRLAPPRF